MAWKELRIGLEHEWDQGDISGKDVLPAALCPKLFNSHEEHRATYGPEIDGLLTAPLLTPLEEKQEMRAAFKKGPAATMKYRPMGKHRLAKGASGSGLFLAACWISLFVECCKWCAASGPCCIAVNKGQN